MREVPKGMVAHLQMELGPQTLRLMICNLMMEVTTLFLPEFLVLINLSIVEMNMLIWNCRGAFNPNFHSLVFNLIRKHYPTIFVIMETKFSGDRAKSIADRLSMDGEILVNNIELSGGLWVLWNPAQVEVTELSTTSKRSMHW